MKHSILIMGITSILLVPALFADTTGTGSTGTGTTSTGITSTGTTGTGTTGTGTTGTGTTGTGTTGTGTTGTGTTGTGTTGAGTQCNTGTVQINQAALLAGQVAFSTEIARLIAVKQTAYTAALTLTGSAQLDALQVANQAFRTGFRAAISKLGMMRQANRSRHNEFQECKKEENRQNRGRGQHKGRGDEHRATTNSGSVMSQGRGKDDTDEDDHRVVSATGMTIQSATIRQDDNNNNRGHGRGGRR